MFFPFSLYQIPRLNQCLPGTLKNIFFEIQRGILKIIQFILSDKHLDGAEQSLRHFSDKFKQCHSLSFLAVQIKSFGTKKIQITWKGGKVSFWKFFRQGWNGRALLVWPSRISRLILKIFLFWVPMNS